jgi:hypothetical protein
MKKQPDQDSGAVDQHISKPAGTLRNECLVPFVRTSIQKTEQKIKQEYPQLFPSADQIPKERKGNQAQKEKLSHMCIFPDIKGFPVIGKFRKYKKQHLTDPCVYKPL